MKQAQSYYSVILKGRFSIYEMRIMLKIVNRTRYYFDKSVKMSDLLKSAVSLDGINVNFAIPVSELIGGKSHNYDQIKEAARRLEKDWQVEYYDKEKKVWHLSSMIYNVRLDERAGVLMFSCADWLLKYIMDFRNGGYRLYDFETAMSLRNAFAARLYLLTCSVTSPQRFPIESLKEVLGVKEQYPRLHDFCRRVLIPAQQELEKKRVNGFTYTIERKYKDKPRSQPLNIILTPVKRGKAALNIGEQIKEAKDNIPESLYLYMTHNLQYTNKEVISNKATITAFCKIENWQVKLGDIVDRMRSKRAGKGYLIAAMKRCIIEQSDKQL